MRKLEEGLIPLLPNEGWEGEEGKVSLARAVNFNSKSHERRTAAPEEGGGGRREKAAGSDHPPLPPFQLLLEITLLLLLLRLPEPRAKRAE